ncbi:MAG: hypothetical protein JXX29_00470 [Deltaproteobacteria bacterium]|nr:hypothetical protein [Deltaproteobacteria bacterium]MBN2670110.1 hypothetical protein [Deltaproteobacteria bacterium]
MRNLLFAVPVMLGLLLAASPAKAELPSKMFRLHLFSNVLEVGTGETSTNDEPDEGYGGLEIGAGMSRFGVGLAGTLGSGFVLGGRVALGQEAGNWTPGNDDEGFVWSVAPYLEYVFLSTRVRPFVKAIAGFEGSHWENNGGFWGALFGGGGGIHIFLRPNVSIDIDLDLVFRVGTGEWSGNRNTPDDDFSHWRFYFGTLFGLSAWL